jgi:hypothetical protein
MRWCQGGTRFENYPPRVTNHEGLEMSAAILSDLERPIAHIIHIGAGTGRDLPAYLTANPAAVTLIEADPETAAQLSVTAAAHPSVTVIEAAVSANLRKRAFRRTNFSDLNSFRKPTGLQELFPGLRTLSREAVKPTDPVRLVRDLDLSRKGSNLLVIEAPGEALGILKALKTADLLLGFDAIRLQEGYEALYHLAPTAQDIRSFLVDAGYLVEFETNPEDPERPYLSARVDRKALETARRISDLTNAATQKAEEQRARLEKRDSEIKQLQEDRDAAAQKAEEQRARLEKRDSEIKQLQEDRDAAAQKAEEQRARLEEVEREAEAMRDELAGAQQNLSVSLRLQMLHDTDLKNLQQRYASLLQSKDAQDKLLERLTVSLSNAARYLQEMDDPTDGEAPVKVIRRKKTPPRKAKKAIASK